MNADDVFAVLIALVVGYGALLVALANRIENLKNRVTELEKHEL